MGRLRLLLVMALSAGMLALGPACSEAAKSAPTKRFSSAGHPESHGLAITLDYPADWKAAEDDQAQSVQKFIATDILAECFLIVTRFDRPMPGAEIAARIAGGNMMSNAYDRANYVQGRPIDGFPAAEYVAPGLHPSNGGKELRKSHGNTIYLGQHAVEWICDVREPDMHNHGRLDTVFDRAFPLFRQIAQSIRISGLPGPRPNLGTKSFTSAGHAKANGLILSLSYPSIFTPSESANPAVLQEFRSDRDVCDLFVMDVGQKLSTGSMAARLHVFALNRKEKGEYLGGGPIDGLPAIEETFAREIPGRAGLQRAITVSTGHGNSQIVWSCSSRGVSELSDEDYVEQRGALHRDIARTIKVARPTLGSAGAPGARFGTAGHPKARGVDLTLDFPADWAFSEDDDPQAVQYFRAPDKRSECLLVIADMGPATTPGAFLQNWIKGTSILKRPDQLELVRNLSIDGLTAGEYRATSRLADASGLMRSDIVLAVAGKRAILWVCSMPDKSGASADMVFGTLLQPVRDMALSMKVSDYPR